ncbi:MAG: hypothetical protein PSU93_01770 [Methylobacter sp.]|uniref:Uncharacterized protein n=1 Tax=Candidatus Methylobacter titanis TaxID=3053457 RepID=A0AA43Q1B4_9GAMM|nr:hypothetical protein [Candidatus Methylobacter titanis]
MNGFQLAHLRDYAIEYLPEAQKVREHQNTLPLDYYSTEEGEFVDSKPYARLMYDVANKVIERKCSSTATEIAAACLLFALIDWELYEPYMFKLYNARNPDLTPENMPDALLPSIANAVATLNNVTGRDVPFVSPLVPFIDSVSDAGAIAKQEAEKTTLSLNDAVRIDEAAKSMKCTVESLLREAANSERLLYVALKPHSSKLVAIPSHPNPRQGEDTTKSHSIVAMLPNYAESIAIAGSADIKQYQASFEEGGLLDWHYWMLDEPQTVGVDMVFVSRAHLTPVVPATDPASTTRNERELTLWLRETWINEGKPGGTAFFKSLKKYVRKDGSPIIQHYTAGKDAGFDWRTSTGTTGTTPKKTVLNKVSVFKKTP